MRCVIRTLDGTIHQLGVEDGSWSSGGGDPVFDLSDRWAVQGLSDAHAHLSQNEMVLEPGDPGEIARRAFATVEAGVFLCLDKGWCDDAVLRVSDVPPSSRPHLQAAGRMIAVSGGYFDGFAVETDEAGLAQEVATAARRGGGWVKLVGDWPRRGVGAVANFSEASLSTAVAVAHAGGARVAIHTMAPDVASTAVRAGVDSIEHGLYLTDEDVAMLGARGGAWVPTVMRMEAVIREVGIDRTGGRVVAAGLDRVRELLRRAPAAGVSVLAGTDLTVPSGRVGVEALRLLDYGLAVEDAVSSATDAAYTYAGLDPGFSVGGSADVVAFDVHPHERPDILLSPSFVMRSGVIRTPSGSGVE